MLQVYNGIIEEQLRRGFIEKVPGSELSKPCHYIPHNGVHKDSVTTPLRIVYAAAAVKLSTWPASTIVWKQVLHFSNNFLLSFSASVLTSLVSLPTSKRRFYTSSYITKIVILPVSSGHAVLVILKVSFKHTASELSCLAQPVLHLCCMLPSTAI